MTKEIERRIKVHITRRGLLLGASAAMLTATGVLGKSSTAKPPLPALPPSQRAADAAAATYVDLLSKVHDDYVNGRVVEHDGWVISQHEAETIDIRRAANAASAAAG